MTATHFVFHVFALSIIYPGFMLSLNKRNKIYQKKNVSGRAKSLDVGDRDCDGTISESIEYDCSSLYCSRYFLVLIKM